MENNIKLLIISSARWGKDTLGEILHEHYGLKFISSSQACSDIFIYDELKDKYGYKTPEECFNDRVNHRQEWYELICEYNKDDKARLAKEILKYNNTYVGMRDSAEIKECLKQGLFDLVIWVDASKRLPPEDSKSFNITTSDADIIIDNNGSLEEFKEKALRLGSLLRR
jgi:dephospho-CoA kinase